MQMLTFNRWAPILTEGAKGLSRRREDLFRAFIFGKSNRSFIQKFRRQTLPHFMVAKSLVPTESQALGKLNNDEGIETSSVPSNRLEAQCEHQSIMMLASSWTAVASGNMGMNMFISCFCIGPGSLG